MITVTLGWIHALCKISFIHSFIHSLKMFDLYQYKYYNVTFIGHIVCLIIRDGIVRFMKLYQLVDLNSMYINVHHFYSATGSRPKPNLAP